MKNNSLLHQFNLADLISLLGLTPIIFAFYFINHRQPFLAIIAICFAFLFDISDGYVARKLNLSSDFGRALDSLLDSLNYLVLTSFFLYTFLGLPLWLNFILIFLILGGGVTRLARHIINGFTENKKEIYYTGLIVPYIQLIVILTFFTTVYFSAYFSYLLLPALPTMSILMIANFKLKKPKNYSLILVLIIFLMILSILNL